MKRRKRDEELIGVILSDCETLARRIDYFDDTENSFVSDRSEEGELAYDAIMSPVYRIARMHSIFPMRSNRLFRSILGTILGVFEIS